MKILPEEVAKIIEASPEFVRVAIQQNKLGYGVAVKVGRRYSYNIQTEEMAKKYGVDVEIINKQLEQIREEDDD